MNALSKWRQSTLTHRNQGTVSRSPSPAASAKSCDEEPLSSGDEGAKGAPQVQNARTTSSSWIRWWNRSQRTRTSTDRPAMPERSSEPIDTKQVGSCCLTISFYLSCPLLRPWKQTIWLLCRGQSRPLLLLLLFPQVYPSQKLWSHGILTRPKSTQRH